MTFYEEAGWPAVQGRWPHRCSEVRWEHGDKTYPWVADPQPHKGSTADADVGDLVWEPKMGEGHVLVGTRICNGTGFYCGYCAGMMSTATGYCESHVLQCECGGLDVYDHHNFLLAKALRAQAGTGSRENDSTQTAPPSPKSSSEGD